MATPSSSSRPPFRGSRPEFNNGVGITSSGRALADLVSKFETLQAPGVNRRPPGRPLSHGRPNLVLPGSQTMPSLNLPQHTRKNLDKTKQNESVKSSSPTPLSPENTRAVAMARAKLATPKLNTSPPKKPNDKNQTAASVAEKRRLFETDKISSSRKPYSTPMTNAKSQMASGAPAMTPRTRAGTPDCNISMPHTCDVLIPTLKAALKTPTKATLGGVPSQIAPHNTKSMSNYAAFHPPVASNHVPRLHKDDDIDSVPASPEKLQDSGSGLSQLQSLRCIHVSSTGSPRKQVPKTDTKSPANSPAPPSPIAVKKPREPLAPTSSLNILPFTPAKSVSIENLGIQRFPSDSTGSVIVTKKPETTSPSTRRWSPQRIVTPQKPTMSKQTSPIGESQGEGKFVKPKSVPNFQDAVGFFEAMSHRASLNTNNYTAPREPAKRTTEEAHVSAKPPASKRERLKGSLRRLSSSLKLKRGTVPQDAKLLSDYPTMWKIGGVESMPRKKLHAEWCELSADHRKPLNPSLQGEISLFDQYLSTSHSKSYHEPKGEDAHVNIIAQQSSLHGIAQMWNQATSETDSSTDRLESPAFNSPETLKPRRRSTRRWFSRSAGTLVSQVHCQLEQPRPVHGVEMKRLISLCKMQGTMKRRGHTE